MNILLASTTVAPLGDGKGGGVDFTVFLITKILKNRGYNVDIIAPQGSKSEIDVKLIEVSGEQQFTAQNFNRNDKLPVFSNLYLTNMWEKIRSIESNYNFIINFSYDWLPYYLTPFLNTSILHFVSMSSLLDEMDFYIKKQLELHPKSVGVYTKTQANTFSFSEKLVKLGMALELDNYKFSQDHENYFIWAGRISEEKGLEDAIKISIETNTKLKIAGKMENEDYYSSLLNKYPNGNFEYLGFFQTNEFQEILRKAKAMLLTSKWVEAFGIVAIEALACGVPVISYNIGEAAEIIINNKTGFLTDIQSEYKGMVKSLEKINNIKREECRKHIQNNYSTQSFGDKLEKWFNDYHK